jgi:hypothetical protein
MGADLFNLHGNFPWTGQFFGWMDEQGMPPLSAVGGNLFFAGRRSITGYTRIEPGFLRSLDLCHAAIVNDQLHDAIAQAIDFFPDERKPVGYLGNGLEGGMHDGKRLD